MTPPPAAVTSFFQKRIANPVMRRMPIQTLLETTGRKSGEPRRTPVGGKLVAGQFWFVSEFGEQSQYIRNIKADPRVRVRLRGKWHSGTAHLSRRRPTCAASRASPAQRRRRTHVRDQPADRAGRPRRLTHP